VAKKTATQRTKQTIDQKIAALDNKKKRLEISKQIQTLRQQQKAMK